MLIGALWWMAGETRRDSVRIRLDDRILADRGGPPGEIERAIRRLGDDLGADISLYDAAGALVASVGRPVPPHPSEIGGRMRIIRVDLADGRVALARLHPPPYVGLRILSIVSIVAGGCRTRGVSRHFAADPPAGRPALRGRALGNRRAFYACR